MHEVDNKHIKQYNVKSQYCNKAKMEVFQQYVEKVGENTGNIISVIYSLPA